MYRSQVEEMVTYTGHGGDEVEAYLSRPSGEGPFPAVVFLHHAPGWDEASIEMARKFAHHGFATIAPHLYSREAKGLSSPEEAFAASRATGGMPDDRVLGDVEGAINLLRDASYTNGKVGVIGGCSGGRQAFMVGCRLPVDAAVDCWGGGVVVGPDQLNPGHPTAVIDMTPDLACPLLGIFGADDYNPTRLQVEMTEEVLRANNKDFEFHFFEDCGHSFMTPDELNYRALQTVDAWKKIFDFFDRQLA
jgi:carboxymethylenebutenolidase